MTHNRKTPRWMTDTEIRLLDTVGGASAEPSRRLRPAIVCGAVALLLLSLGANLDHAAGADHRGDREGWLALLPNVKVAWAGEHDAIIASDDSLALAEGDWVTFVSGNKRVAMGSVRNLIQSNVALVGFDGGPSLKGMRKLNRLKVVADSRSVQTPGELRLGYPAGSRSNLLFYCERVTPRPPGLEGVYRTETLTDRHLRLVRNAGAVPSPPWPDTILIRFFDDSADEEIAMERGDLDIAMFWPGELSSHARSLWPGRRAYSRTRGLLAAMWLEAPDRPHRPLPGAPGVSDDFYAVTVSDRQALWRLGRELFNGDLGLGFVLTWRPDSSLLYHLFPDSSWKDAARFEVDHALPGWRVMERFLNTRPDSRVVKPSPNSVKLVFLDVPPWDGAQAISQAIAEGLRAGPFPPALRARADSLVAETRAPGYPTGFPGFSLLERRLRDQLRIELVIPSCPLLWRSGLGRFSDELAEALVNLLDCSPAPRR